MKHEVTVESMLHVAMASAARSALRGSIYTHSPNLDMASPTLGAKSVYSAKFLVVIWTSYLIATAQLKFQQSNLHSKQFAQ